MLVIFQILYYHYGPQLSGTLLVFTGGNFYFFHAHIFRFHEWDLAENFTGTVDFSRTVSKNFSREGKFFHGRKSKNFHGKVYFFDGEKENTANMLLSAPT